MRTVIVGTAFRGAAAIEALRHLRQGQTLTLVREPDNPHDPHAVAVYAGAQHLGYIPKAHNQAVAELIHDGDLEATVVSEPIVRDDNSVFAAPRIQIDGDG